MYTVHAAIVHLSLCVMCSQRDSDTQKKKKKMEDFSLGRIVQTCDVQVYGMTEINSVVCTGWWLMCFVCVARPVCCCRALRLVAGEGEGRGLTSGWPSEILTILSVSLPVTITRVMPCETLEMDAGSACRRWCNVQCSMSMRCQYCYSPAVFIQVRR
jgi:hypothetical protein